VRIGRLTLLYADVHARRLDPVDLHCHSSSPLADVHQRRGCRYDPGYCKRGNGEARIPAMVDFGSKRASSRRDLIPQLFR
jgi:hypothetical protein